jgi:hypothetical protein
MKKTRSKKPCDTVPLKKKAYYFCPGKQTCSEVSFPPRSQYCNKMYLSKLCGTPMFISLEQSRISVIGSKSVKKNEYISLLSTLLTQYIQTKKIK